jgi:hypothetical protein
MCWALKVAVITVSLATAAEAFAQQPEMTWQDAIAELSAERTRAETCVRLLKRYASDDPAAISQGELAYSEAKADVDGVISGLIIALAQNEEPESLKDLGAMLTRGVLAREEFCAMVKALVPEDPGTKGIEWAALLAGPLGSLIDAAKEIYLYHAKTDDESETLRIKTIQTQLESLKWPSFGDIKPQ